MPKLITRKDIPAPSAFALIGRVAFFILIAILRKDNR